jgi:ATP adenylyltransferase
MDHLYAPWRDVYLKNKNSQKTVGCPFCSKFEQMNDQENLIIRRHDTCAVMLNLYPYGLGHMLIIPYKHVKSLTDLTKQEQYDLIEVVAQSMDILENHFSCDGINMGMNKGKSSGGSVNDHLHIHIVPRFIGDANFLTTCALTKTLSFDMEAVYKNLVSAFNQ